MSMKTTWDKFPPWIKTTSKIVTTLASFAAVYAMVNTFMGVTIRPAWVWELDALREEVDALRRMIEP